jgi:hypothetical protein
VEEDMTSIAQVPKTFVMNRRQWRGQEKVQGFHDSVQGVGHCKIALTSIGKRQGSREAL